MKVKGRNRGLWSFSFSVIPCLAILLSLFLLSSSGGSTGKNSPKNPLNVLLITVDTLRADRLSCYGNARLQTRAIDALAERGALFTRAFAHTPTTLPSHTNILLGTTPLTHGVHDNANFIVDKKFPTLATYLKSYGYATGAFVGAFPLDSRFGLTQGFDVYDDNYGTPANQEFTFVERKAEVVVEQALSWLSDRNPNEKWFLWIHCFDPHQRYLPPEPFQSLYKDRPYEGEIAYVDFALGKLLGYLEDKKLTENTLIVFTGDHGESLGQHGESTHGYFAYNATLQIPLLIVFPGIKKGTVEQNVAHIDIFPTVCDVLGIDRLAFLQGISLLPAIKGRKLPDRMIYFESLYPYYSRGWAPLQGYIEGTEKFIETPIPEVYDLEADFDEMVNMAEQKKLDKHREKLGRLIAEFSSSPLAQTRPVDRETQERLQSLGYVSIPQALAKRNFTDQDDLKILLPYQNMLQQAMAAYHRRDLEEGAKLLRRIIAERKDFDLAYSYLATIYKDQKRLKEAVAVLKEGVENNPQSIKILSTYGIFLVEVRAYDAAIEILKKTLSLIDYDPDVWNYLGVAYYHKGSYAEALKAYDRVLALDDNYPVVFNNLGSLHFSVFLKTKEKTSYDKAVASFRRAIELDPNYPSAYNGLGVALRQAGDLDGAIQNWEKAVEVKPDYGFALYNLGLACAIKGDKKKALEHLTKYKEEFYSLLTAEEQVKLDKLMASLR
ncbi:MAG: sulfatase-like hydrolase/transferase [Clostridiales bacterium]|nr:sulfatase-like hydrolase/transferase [Clostridiales bacterium]